MNSKRVLFLIGCLEGESKRYRVHNHIEALRLAGWDGEWIWDIHPQAFEREFIEKHAVLVIFRAGFNDNLDGIIKLARACRIPIVYDTDDLVFDSSIIDQIDAYRLMDEKARADYRFGIDSMRAALLTADFISTSTSFLTEYLCRFQPKPVYHLPFGYSVTQGAISSQLSDWSGSARFIGYLSGTKTHQKDFEVAAKALRQIFDEYSDVYLKLVGFLNTDVYFPNHANRVIKLPFMNWRDLLIETGSLYFNIAPLEIESVFCNAKSELKFTEAAICGVPTICSPIPSYSEAIESGRNGILANTVDEWYSAMKAMLDDRERRNAMGRAARATALERFNPTLSGKRLVKAFESMIETYKGAKA